MNLHTVLRPLLALLPVAAVLAADAEAPAAAEAQPAESSPAASPSAPMFLHGFASLEGFRLMDPWGEGPLTTRHIEVITVVGEVDPPYADGDDRIQTVNPEYNYPRYKNLMNENPGMVTASFTIFVEEPNPDDERVQLWETVVVRVYNAENKDDATFYCDTTPWKTQPGFSNLTAQQVQFGEWKPMPTSTQHSN